jgi:serine/threonine protein kinase
MLHGRYTVVRKIAEGGMAEIFLARQHGSEGFEKPVVLKRIHTGFAADEQFRNMLVDEAHISMGLHHNNIVQVLDLGRANGRMFLVLELIDGWDLAWVLERAETAKRPLPTGIALYLMAETCRALSYAHGRSDAAGQPLGIVHRDVSPQNVLLSEQGEVKLADFGIAKALTKRDRTATGVVKGKIAFMSPEQSRGESLDARSDLFSLGTMLYLVTTGVRPFDAATDFEVLARVQKGAFTPPEDVRPDMAPALAAIIRRAMSADREQRYQTADELLVDLEGIWRVLYSAPGQTELKLWLAELKRVDSVPSIGKAIFDNGEDEISGVLAAGAAVQLGDERSGGGDGSRWDRAAVAARPGPGLGSVEAPAPSLKNDRPSLRDLDTLGALEDTSGTGKPVGARDPTLISRQRATTRRPRITGKEATTMSDLALSVGDDSMEMIARIKSRSRRRAAGAGFLALVLLGGAGAAAMWRMGVARREATEAAGVPSAATAPAARPPGPPPSRPVVARPTAAVPASGAPPATSPPGAAAGRPAVPAPGAPPPVASGRPAALPGKPDAGRPGGESDRVRLWRERERRWGTARPAPGASTTPPPVEIVNPPAAPVPAPPPPAEEPAKPPVQIIEEPAPQSPPPAEPAPPPAASPPAPAPEEPAKEPEKPAKEPEKPEKETIPEIIPPSN